MLGFGPDHLMDGMFFRSFSYEIGGGHPMRSYKLEIYKLGGRYEESGILASGSK